MATAFLVGGVRTPFGRYGGALAGVRPDDLAALVVRAAVERTGIDPGRIDDVILGAANQAGEDNRNVARMAVLLAGLGDQVPGFTVNRLCASGLTAIRSALLGRLERHDGRRGLASLCVGVGQGASMLIARD
jgi:acetyl-CoA acetyltransferase